jgi:hypothetical protein
MGVDAGRQSAPKVHSLILPWPPPPDAVRLRTRVAYSMWQLERYHKEIEQPTSRQLRAADGCLEGAPADLSSPNEYPASSAIGAIAGLDSRDTFVGNRFRAPEICRC